MLYCVKFQTAMAWGDTCRGNSASIFKNYRHNLNFIDRKLCCYINFDLFPVIFLYTSTLFIEKSMLYETPHSMGRFVPISKF